MRRSCKIVLAIVGVMAVFVLIAIVALIALATFDWNRAKPWVVEKVGHAIGRELAIDGDLQVNWQRDPQLHGLRAWIPGPHITAAKVTLVNPEWAKQRQFATVESVELELAVLPLLTHTVSILSVRVVDPSVNLERLSDGRDNWTFAAQDDNPASPWKFELGRVKLDRGKFTFNDRQRDLELKASIDALKTTVAFDDEVTQQEQISRSEAAANIGESAANEFATRAQQRVGTTKRSDEPPQRYAFSWSAEGKLAGAAIKGSGRIGSEFAFKHPDQTFPLQADVRIGATRIALIGTLTDPASLDGLDLRLWLSGSNLGQLYDIFRVTLPDSPPYATEGRLVGRFVSAEKKLRYQNFTARVGGSDLSGDLLFESRDPRPRLTGKVQSDLLQFRDLAPMIGAGGAESNSTETAAIGQSAGKVLPAAPFRPERWRAMDADVEFSGDRVFRDAQLPIHKVDTRIVMDDAILSLKPMRFSYAHGDVDASMRFDGQNAPIKGVMQLSARGMQLKNLLPSLEAMKASLGEANGEAHLSGTGNSVGELLGAANGEVKLLLNDGTISKALLETAGLNLPNIVVTKVFGDKQISIDCAASDFVATGGVYNAQLFVIDTDIARIDITGSVNVGTEKLDLTVHPDSKNLRFLSLRAPIQVQGTFRQPDVSIDKRVLLARSAGAIGLAILATPVAALLPLTATSSGGDTNPCAGMLKQMQQAAASKPRASR